MDNFSGIIDTNTAMQSIQSGSTGFLSGFSTVSLIIGIVVSIIAMAYIKNGNKNGKTMSLICGVIMLVIPYFVYNPLYLVLVSVVLISLPLVFKN